MSSKIVEAEEANPQLETFLQSVERDLNYLNDNLNKINSYRDKFDSNKSMNANAKGDLKKDEAPSNYKERMEYLEERFHKLNELLESELNLMNQFV